MIYTENMLSLFPNRFRIYHSGMWIKRESGVNPGQSRCCEAPNEHLETTLSPLVLATGKASRWESVRRPAIH